MNKLVIVIPALNEQNLILKTLDSLSKQTNKEFSVIVVDNGSTDGTQEIITRYSKKSLFKLLSCEETKIGVGNARNTGSLKAIDIGALYIAGTDADTVLPTNWVESIYAGFENKKYDLLSGECDPFSNVEFDNERAKTVLQIRSLLFRKIKPYLRGANFAISRSMFIRAGGFVQSLTKEGKPAPGEDGQLELSSLKQGAKISGCLATVYPHPRRYISNLQKINNFNGSVHEGGVVIQVRDENSLEDYMKTIPDSAMNTFLDKVVISLFNEFVLEVYKNETLRSLYWENSLTFLKPFTRLEIEEDINAIDDQNLIWLKYKNAFFNNTKIIQLPSVK